MAPTDATVKVYHRGNLAGKFAIFFTSEKAMKIAKEAGIKDNLFAANNTDINLKKAEAFLARQRLRYDMVIFR
jgi:hypothetical protein